MIGFYFLSWTLDLQIIYNYRNFLNRMLKLLMEDIPLDAKAWLGVRHITNGLNCEYYSSKRIGCGDPIHCPSLSPDLTPSEFLSLRAPQRDDTSKNAK